MHPLPPPAAHCVYDRNSKVWTGSANFLAGHYRTSGGAATAPFGTASSSYFGYQTGWVTETSQSRAWWYDVATVVLRTKVSASTGCAAARGAFGRGRPRAPRKR